LRAPPRNGEIEDELLRGEDKDRIDEGKLDKLTMTALKVRGLVSHMISRLDFLASHRMR
jgi:hypothetical protein